MVQQSTAQPLCAAAAECADEDPTRAARAGGICDSYAHDWQREDKPGQCWHVVALERDWQASDSRQIQPQRAPHRAAPQRDSRVQVPGCPSPPRASQTPGRGTKSSRSWPHSACHAAPHPVLGTKTRAAGRSGPMGGIGAQGLAADPRWACQLPCRSLPQRAPGQHAALDVCPWPRPGHGPPELVAAPLGPPVRRATRGARIDTPCGLRVAMTPSLGSQPGSWFLGHPPPTAHRPQIPLGHPRCDHLGAAALQSNLSFHRVLPLRHFCAPRYPDARPHSRLYI
jgi:hypothetical protein